ncbi:hypothetical protein DOY81_002510 [Sarcophaga bullata]|nr:hypothetical protein DOY81_002510 [Sarcophaga bullata]
MRYQKTRKKIFFKNNHNNRGNNSFNNTTTIAINLYNYRQKHSRDFNIRTQIFHT